VHAAITPLIEGNHLGEGNRSARLAGEDTAWRQGCSACAASQWVLGDRTLDGGSYVAEDVDENVVVIGGADFEGLVVIPRRHVGGLEQLPSSRQALLLAALQRAKRSVLEQNPGFTTRIVVMTGPPASEGHTCFHVLPSTSQDPPQSPSMPA
jgi:hypothetical protein